MMLFRGLYVTTKNIILSKTIRRHAFDARKPSDFDRPPVPRAKFSNGVPMRDVNGVVTREYPPWLFRDEEPEPVPARGQSSEPESVDKQKGSSSISDLIEGWESGRFATK